MRLYTHTHTHTSVLKNRKNEKQEEVNDINFLDNLWEEKNNKKDNVAASTNYVNNTTKNYNKAEQNKSEKKIEKKKGKLQKVSCLLVVRKKVAVVIALMIIVLAIFVCFGIKYNWRIENIIEEICNVIHINGTSADIEEVAAMDMTKIDLVPDKNGVNVPVPKGYVLSGASDENDVTKGAVIYEGEAEVTDVNVAAAKTTRNQWVWVPVSAGNVGRIYSEDAYGRKSGKLYDYSSSGRTESTIGLEPGILTDRDNEEYFQQYNLYGYTRNKLYEEMQKNYEQTIESIKTYGGFYIGRYETGNLSQRKPVCVQYNADIASQTWYAMYNKAQYIGGSASVKSMMIYGSLFDEVLMWLYESGAKNYDEIGEDSTSWGNYVNANFDYYATAETTIITEKSTGKLLPTGAKAGASGDNWKRNCANNIYDLAGNVREQTQECDYNGGISRINRGGDDGNTGNYRPVGTRSPLPPESRYYYLGIRMHLIIS